jgi:predicted RNase H-like HicB family nuclease
MEYTITYEFETGAEYPYLAKCPELITMAVGASWEEARARLVDRMFDVKDRMEQKREIPPMDEKITLTHDWEFLKGDSCNCVECNDQACAKEVELAFEEYQVTKD